MWISVQIPFRRTPFGTVRESKDDPANRFARGTKGVSPLQMRNLDVAVKPLQVKWHVRVVGTPRMHTAFGGCVDFKTV
jgi:hypothetical protein